MAFTKVSTAVLAAVALFSSLGGSAPAGSMTPVKRDLNAKFNFGSQKVRGVNLGGWFVLEPWITPSVFEACPENVVDEWTMGQVLGREEAHRRLEQHWSSWITAKDFSEIAAHGLNFVRIPIGYWSVKPIAGQPYVQGAYKHLNNAIQWAAQNNLKVMIDLHGAPGSQNGFDNSGKKGPIRWTQHDSVHHTHAALNKIRDDHASNPAVAAIELINEPMGPKLNMGTVKQFYYDGWGDLRDNDVAVTFHDAFEGVTSWNDFGAGMWNLLLDTHHYEVFDSGALQMGVQDHISTACNFGNQMASNNKWTIAGEWCGAMTDCAKWLNGRGVGARYDGSYPGSYYIGSCDGYYTGSVHGLSAQAKHNIGSFIRAQMVAFEKANGWIFWTWKTESAPEWDYQELAKAGVIPRLNSLDYSICG